jgi:lipid-binding SYLF domain-containing protein
MMQFRLARLAYSPWSLLALAVALLALPAPAAAQGRPEARVILSTQVMEELRGQRDQYVPDLLLDRAFGIAIVPEVKKGAFGLGFRGGKGVLLVRDKTGRFSNPVFISLAGGSFGWQIGVQSTDLVLVFTTRSGVEGITDGKLTLGADASVAAGPVGRSASAATDATFTGAEIYSYSRSSGIFAGVALDGTVISIDKKANADFYGQRRVGAGDIISGSVTKDAESVRRLMASVATSGGASRAAGSSPTPGGSVPPASTPAPAPAGSAEAKTFPMEDAAPGQEPPK